VYSAGQARHHRGMKNRRPRIATRKGPGVANAAGTEGNSARRSIEILRTLILRRIEQLSASGEPVSADDAYHLALALSRVEAADRSRIAREREAGGERHPAYPHLSHLIPANPTYPA